MAGTDGPSGEHAALVLPPDATAPAAARRFLSDRLAAWGCPGLADDAALCVGELVTNAVLHARTEIRLDARFDAGRLHVSVADGSDVPVSLPAEDPVEEDWAVLALTGRGLQMVGRVAARWGSEPVAGAGKRVWFELAAGPGPAVDAGPQVVAASRAAPGRPRVGVVRLEGIPPRLVLASDAHLDDLLREFTLATAHADGRTVPSISPEVARLVEGLLARYAAVKAAGHEQAQAAAAAGRARVTIELELPPDVADHADAFLVLMDEVDRICREGSFLSLVSDPEVAAFRRWYVTEAARQAAGKDPEPCPFPEQPGP